MSIGADGTSELNQVVAAVVASHGRRLQCLPEPSETFLLRELPEEVYPLHRRLVVHGAIERVHKRHEEDEEVNRWRTTQPLYEALQEYDSTPAPGQRVTPCCEYSGFENLRDGDFACALCGTEFEEFAMVEGGEKA